MKTQSELTDFYYKKLHPSLIRLEKSRKQLSHRIITVALIYSIVSLLTIFSLYKISYNLDIIIFGGFLYIAGGGLLYKYLIKDYTAAFKQSVIAPLISALDKNLIYSTDAHIPSHYFTSSKIFTTHPDKFEGNDYVKGKIDDVTLQFSDIHAQKKHKDSKGNTHYETLFQGLFIVADFHKHFKGTTVVLPDSAQTTFGTLIGHWLQSHNISRGELVKMDDVNFEKKFVVYANDQIEARYILSNALMQKLLEFQKRSEYPVSLSFVGGNIFLAIHYNKDLFEPSIFHSLLKYKIAMQYVNTLHLAVGIVEGLKLNQKLWSKL